MSLIIYKDDCLYADDAGFVSNKSTSYQTSMEKMFIYDTFAIAFVGQTVDKNSDSFKKYITALEKELQKYQHLEKESFKVDSLGCNNRCIVITRHNTYFSEDSVLFQTLPNDSILCEGMGAAVAKVVLCCYKKSVKEAFNYYRMISPCSNHSVIFTCNRAELNEFSKIVK